MLPCGHFVTRQCSVGPRIESGGTLQPRLSTEVNGLRNAAKCLSATKSVGSGARIQFEAQDVRV